MIELNSMLALASISTALLALQRTVFDLCSRRTMRYELRKTHKRILAKKAILLVKRIIDRKGQYEKTEIEIHHRALHDALLNINRDRSCEYLGLTKKTPTVGQLVAIY